MSPSRWTTALACLAGLAMGTTAQAADFTFAGNFTDDNDVLLFNFSVGAPSTVTVFSSSWLYGNPPDGSGNGGFDPMLGIWTASGGLIEFQDDGGNTGSTLVNSVPFDHGTWDSYYVVSLDPGDYIASVTQYSNFNNGSSLADGFRYDDNPNFTFDLGYGGATQPLFNGVWDSDDPRTSFWRFHLLNVADAQIAPVPVPAALPLLLSGLTALAFAGRRRKPAA